MSEGATHPRKRVPSHLAQAVCPSTVIWKRLARARDMNGTDVQVYQPPHPADGQQWFYVTSCNLAKLHNATDCPGCCKGIDHSR